MLGDLIYQHTGKVTSKGQGVITVKDSDDEMAATVKVKEYGVEKYSNGQQRHHHHH
ncbi:MAG: hypothetical protein ICV56_10545, partial [Nitrososphaeraceae archaeon]|nr:hypothetical protein [Nitrososphaeraceae archaeon]